MKPGRPERPDGPDLRPERPDRRLERPERTDWGPERPERPNLRPGLRTDLRPARGDYENVLIFLSQF